MARRCRPVVLLLALLLAATPAMAAGLPRIGILAVSPPGTDLPSGGVFVEALRELGWIDGRTAILDWKVSHGDAGRYEALAAELVRAGADVIVASAPNALLAASQATGSIPIVMVNTADPVQLGIVASLGRPGGNITGTSSLSAEVSAKQLQLLAELLGDGARRFGVVSVAGNPWHALAVAALETDAGRLGITLARIEADSPEAIERGLATLAERGTDGVLVLSDPMTLYNRKRIAAAALARHLPTAFGLREHAEAGGLLSYWAEGASLWRRTAAYVDRLLRGAAPADLPIEQPTRYELVINLGTARALGIAVPPALLVRADDVLQ